MENKAYAFAAGLFALLLCGALLAGLWWLAGTHTEEKQYQILSQVPVSGLNSQAAVRYRGVTVGRVDDIRFDPADARNIIIQVSLDSSLRLTKGSFAQLASQGLTGLAYIEMDDTGANPAPLGNTQIPLRQSAISELMGSGKDIIKKTEKLEEHADKLLVTLNTLLNAENSQKINRLIDNMERSTAALEPLLRSSQHTSEKMSKLVDEIQPNQLSDTLEAIRQASASAKETADTARPTLVQVQKSMAELEQVSHRIEQVTADLGENLNYETLPRIHELAHQLNRDAKSLNRLMETLEEDPQSAIFGKAIAKPGPGEKGFQP